MSLGWLAEDAFAKLRRQTAVIAASKDSNEATTRLRAIDTMLFEILRWDKIDVETEKYARAEGYADYAFGADPDLELILEAKRDGIHFVLPDSLPTDRAIPFELLAHECPAAADAFRQAIGYATQLGATYIAISNGHQWVLSLTFVPKVPLESRSVLAFPSIESITNNFRAFWDAFSPLAIRSHSPTLKLLEHRFDPPPAKLSTRIANYPEPATRNTLRNALSPLIEPIWANVTQQDANDEFLKKCYIKPNEDHDDTRIAKELIESRRTVDHQGVAEGEPHAASDAPDLLKKNYETNRPIAVLGRVGHGKSIFLQYLRRVEAASELEGYIQIDIDFLDRPDGKNEVPGHIYNEIDRQLRFDYNIDIQDNDFARSVLNLDIERFHRSSRGQLLANDPKGLALAETEKLEELQRDRHAYLGAALNHIRHQARHGHKHSLAIFFDNLDRQDDGIQEAAFLRASAIARDWNCLVFICLRPGTFQRSRTEGVLDAVAPRVIMVSAPRTDVLLRRRFAYAAELARNSAEMAAADDSTIDSAHGLNEAADFFDICEDSFRRSRELSHLFSSVSNGNARAILHYVRQLIRSGHLNTDKMFQIVEDEGRYVISKHEALRSLLYGDYKQYDPHGAPFINMFDIEHSERREHFTRLLTLNYLMRAPTGDHKYGFVSVDTIEAYLHSCGYTSLHARGTLKVLYQAKCIEGHVFDAKYEDAGGQLRVTALGRYHVTDLVTSFTYLDAISVDTPILDDEVRVKVKNVEEVRARLSRARDVLRYLDNCARDLTDADAARTWSEVHDAVAADITRIENDA